MNRRRPWHQRLVRNRTRPLPLGESMVHSPLGVLFAFNFLSCLLAVLFGYKAVAVVLAAVAIGCLARQYRNNSNLLI